MDDSYQSPSGQGTDTVAVAVSADSPAKLHHHNGATSESAMYNLEQDNDAFNGGDETDALTGRPVSRHGTVKASFNRDHSHNAIEYELDKLKSDDGEHAAENRAKVIRSMPTTLNKKRELR